MKGLNRVPQVFAMLAMLFFGCGRCLAGASQELRAASALFERFETVFYAEGNFLSSGGPYKGLSKQDTNALRMPFAFFIGDLAPLGKEISAAILENAKAVLVGARGFRAPVGLGAVRSQFCYLIVLGRLPELDLRRYFGEATLALADGMPVWKRLAPPMEGDPEPGFLYAAEVAHSYFSVSNNLEELQIVAKRLTSSDDDARILTEVRQWETVSKQKFWGYRRYRHSGIVDRVAAGMEDVTPSAEALIVLIDVKKRICTLRLLLSPPVAERTPAKMNERGNLPPFRPGGPGIWQTTIPLAGDEDTLERMFVIMGLFGFAVYL